MSDLDFALPNSEYVQHPIPSNNFLEDEKDRFLVHSMTRKKLLSVLIKRFLLFNTEK